MPKPDAKILKIERLQNAALELMRLMNSELKQSAPKGLFRISAGKKEMDKKMVEIQNGKLDFKKLTQIDRADLLKRVLRELQNEDIPLFSDAQFETLKLAKETGDKEFNEAISKLEMNAMNQKIAYYLFKLLNNALSKKEQTLMDASSLGRMLGPNVFEIPKNSDPLTQLNNAPAQNAIVVELVTKPLFTQPKMEIKGIHYEHEVEDKSKNRRHLYNASDEGLQEDFRSFKGDFLKSKILYHFKNQLENATAENIDRVVEDIKKTKEYNALATGQGFMTRRLHLDTSSVKAFNEMVAERKADFDLEKSFTARV